MDQGCSLRVVEESKVRWLKRLQSNLINLSKKLVHNLTNMWIRREGGFHAIVLLEQFLKTQEIMRSRSAYPNHEEMLEHLRRLRVELEDSPQT
jgi:hypothetical protein